VKWLKRVAQKRRKTHCFRKPQNAPGNKGTAQTCAQMRISGGTIRNYIDAAERPIMPSVTFLAFFSESFAKWVKMRLFI
jgi:hypothetical protein